MFYFIPRWLAPWLMLLVAVVVGWPGIETAAGAKSTDGFPLSNYPMFSSKRPDPRYYNYVRAVGDDGRTRIVKHPVWSWGGMNQALSQVMKMRRGAAAVKLCERAATRIANNSSFRRYDHVEVVRDGWNLKEYFGERKLEPVSHQVLARCEIPHGSGGKKIRQQEIQRRGVQETLQKTLDPAGGRAMTEPAVKTPVVQDSVSKGSVLRRQAVKAWIVKRFREAFTPEHGPSNMAVMRWIIGVYAINAMLELNRTLPGVSKRMEAHLFQPVGPVRLLSEPVSEETLKLVLLASIVTGVLYVAGVAYRLIGPLFSLLALWLLAYRNSWAFVYHTQQLLALHLLILGFAPAADRFSVDAWLRTRSWFLSGSRSVLGRVLAAVQGPALTDRGASFRYGWPVQLAILVTGVAYWISGVAKLRNGGGLDWVFEGVLAQHVGDNALRYVVYRDVTQEIAFQLFQAGPIIPVLLGGASLLLELTAPLAILHRRLAYLFALSLFGFHLGVLWLMGITFDYQLTGVCFAPFVRWDLVLQTTSRLKDYAVSKWGPAG